MPPLRATAGSLAFLVLAPGVIAGLIPWMLTGWQESSPWPPLQAAGLVLVLGGIAVLLNAFARFVVEGRGTPAPVAPTQRLVVGGLYRYVRNPMYLAVGATIVGQAMILGRADLLVYASVFGAVVVAFVLAYEEPTLTRRYGEQYEIYRRAVPAWWPRRRPWTSA